MGKKAHNPRNIVPVDDVEARMLEAERIRTAKPPTLTTNDLAQRVAEATRKAMEALQAEAEAFRLEGGPCRYCGSRSSASWHGNGFDLTCEECVYEFSFDASEEMRKERVIRSLFTRRELQGWVGSELVRRAGFEWFHETSAVVAYSGRWGYVTDRTRKAVVARLIPDGALPPHDEHCPRCGCDGAWEWTLPHATIEVSPARQIHGTYTAPTERMTYSGGVGWRCTACVGMNVEDAALSLVPDARVNMVGRRRDPDAINRAGVVWFVQIDHVTRRNHDPSRPYSWLSPKRIAKHLGPK